MAQPEALETYTRTISTMSEVIENLRDVPDPDGSMTHLVDRIAVEREWVRALMALGEEPRRPPGWLAASRRGSNALDSYEPRPPGGGSPRPARATSHTK
jgi:hypothetical protein